MATYASTATNTATVYDLIAHRPVLKFDCGEPVTAALGGMEKEGHHAVGVLWNGDFRGLFTYGDFVRRVVGKKRDSHQTTLVEVMTHFPLTVGPECDACAAFEIMCDNEISHLPVVVKRNLLGIVSEDDLRHVVARNMRKLDTDRKHLLSYIYGESYGVGAEL